MERQNKNQLMSKTLELQLQWKKYHKWVPFSCSHDISVGVRKWRPLSQDPLLPSFKNYNNKYACL